MNREQIARRLTPIFGHRPFNRILNEVEAIVREAEAAARAEAVSALIGLDEAYCRANTPLTAAERHEDRKRLIAAREVVARARGETTT